MALIRYGWGAREICAVDDPECTNQKGATALLLSVEQPVPIFDRRTTAGPPRPSLSRDEAQRFHSSRTDLEPPQRVIRHEVSPPQAQRMPHGKERHRASGHIDQLMAAAASVVWMAGFVQSIVDEITGEEPQE